MVSASIPPIRTGCSTASIAVDGHGDDKHCSDMPLWPASSSKPMAAPFAAVAPQRRHDRDHLFGANGRPAIDLFARRHDFLADPAATERWGGDCERLAPGDVSPCSGRSAPARRAGPRICGGSAIGAKSPVRPFRSSNPICRPTRVPVWHVDLYRIEHEDELEELGLDEARQNGVLIIEWPERLPRLWPDTLKLIFDSPLGGGRALTAEVPPAWGGRWPP